MKILISNDGPTAHYYIRKGWQNAFNYCGHQCLIWNINEASTFDVFNKFEPDVLITQVYNLSNDIFKCIYNRPHLKVIMKAPDYGNRSYSIKDKYPILYASEEHINNIKTLKQKTGKPDFLFVHYPEEYLWETHGYWEKMGIKVVSLLNAADVIEFNNGQYDERLYCDMSILGGYWGYKSLTLNPYIVSLCKDFKYNIKIFGNQPWPVPQYCGFLPNEKAKDLFISSSINLNVHEKHSQDFGFDIVERPFKILACGGFLVSDYVEGLHKLLPNIPMGKTPEEFKELIDFYLKNIDARKNIVISNQKEVLANHTYFNRCQTILKELDLPTTKIDNIINTLRGNK